MLEVSPRRSVLRPWHLNLLAGLLAVGLRLAILPLIPIPSPIIHDEFSYLLGADTFASGRVTNPTHPLWVHFETLHVNFQPTYCSKYPPAQALFLALGQTLLGQPWFGVCLSSGFLFAALCWMLQGWVSPGYAFLTTLLGILGWGLTGETVNSYWGGAVAAAGGALVIGAIPRVGSRPTASTVLPGCAGLVLLANSRPFEGLLTACAAAAVLVWRVRSVKRPVRSLVTRRTLVPFLLIMAAGAGAMGYYNYRTTGNALLLPYELNQQTYSAPPLFYWLPLPAAGDYRHEDLRRYWVGWNRFKYERARNHPVRTIRESLETLGFFYLLNPFSLLIAAEILFWRGRDAACALLLVAVPLAGILLLEYVLPHYLAPAFGALLLVGAFGLQHTGRVRSAGPILIAALIGISAAWSAVLVQREAGLARTPPLGIANRPMVIERLERQGGRHLVIVRYGLNHEVQDEWVYNRANIDASDIVWAQDMGAARNRELLEYYRGRKTWLLEPDVDPLALMPYDRPAPP